MVVNSHTGVDPCILRHQITDLQQDVTSIPGEEEEEEEVTELNLKKEKRKRSRRT